jgi:hypothetical protein
MRRGVASEFKGDDYDGFGCNVTASMYLFYIKVILTIYAALPAVASSVGSELKAMVTMGTVCGLPTSILLILR